MSNEAFEKEFDSQEAPTVQREVDKDIAKEYMEWIDFFHAGNGDYSDFLKSKGLAN